MGGFRAVLAGAAFSNGNRGVEALGRSVADSVDASGYGDRLSVLDDGWGVRRDESGRYGFPLEYVGVRLSRRWHRPESWAQIRAAQVLAHRANPVARRFAEADAVLDISGGDSFTDLYGPARLAAIAAPKEAALRAGRPLVLLPQTYGPFATADGRRRAERLVRSAALAYARDDWSYQRLLELAGPGADRSRLRSGVDVAFGLRARRPAAALAEEVESYGGEVLAGVNVSGLLRDPAARERFGLAGDFLATMTDVVRRLVQAGAHAVLVPHVHVPGGGGESDVAAIEAVLSGLSDAERARTTVLPAHLDAAELKWCIGRMDWFVGSRMHATIGALSTGVPAFGYAYSDKTHGVFETCGMGAQVADARRVAGPEAVELMMASFELREQTRSQLAELVPAVVTQSVDQLADVLADVRRWQLDPATVEAIA